MKHIQDLSVSFLVKADEAYPRHSEASMVACKDGSLKIAWQRFENSEFGPNDNAPATIVMMDCPTGKPQDGWTNLRTVAECIPGCVNVYSPNLIYLKDGSLMLLYMRYTHEVPGDPELTSCYAKISYDDGASFGEEKIIWNDQSYSIANSSIRRLKSGRLIVPLNISVGELWTPTEHRSATTMYSDDDGKTWTFSSHVINLPMRGVMEPFVDECPDGRLMMVMRCQLGSVMCCYSSDEGVTWTKPQTTGLRAPESCPNIIKVPDSDTLMFIWNNSEYDPAYASHYGKRTPLTVAFSDDSGKTFYGLTDIENDPDCVFTNPAVTWTRDGRCLVTYFTSNYQPGGFMGGKISLKIAVFSVKDS